jgi:palmitoyltransferase
MLLLIYVLITTYFIFFSTVYDFVLTIKWEIDTYYYSKSTHDQNLLMKTMLIQVSFIVNCLIGMLMTFFTKFHFWLVSNNKTTIENLEKKGRQYRSLYDIGPDSNWFQVFGTNKLLWPFPMFMGSGKPLGDGIYWPNNQGDNKDSIVSPSAD